MSANTIYIDAFWVGSNVQIATKLGFEVDSDPQQNAVRLQQVVAGLIDANTNADTDHTEFKVCLGLPSGPELTPVLPTVETWKHPIYDSVLKPKISKAQQNMSAAWTLLFQQTNVQTKPAVRVFVTKHSAADIAVAELIYAYETRRQARTFNTAIHVQMLYNGMSDKLRKNPKVAVAAIKTAYITGLKIPSELCSNKQFILSVLTNCSTKCVALQFAGPKLTNDRALVVACIQADSNNFRHAAQHLRDDEDVFFAAFNRNPKIIAHAGLHIRGDKATMLACISQWPNSFKFASDTLKADTDVALAAVSKDGRLLCEAFFELRDNKTVVLAAVAKQGRALAYASKALQGDKEVVLLAVSNDSEALK